MVIPLRHENIPGVRKTGFVPLIGYSDAEGFYIKTRIGFGTSNQYYGYYRVEFYTRSVTASATWHRSGERRQTFDRRRCVPIAQQDRRL